MRLTFALFIDAVVNPTPSIVNLSLDSLFMKMYFALSINHEFQGTPLELKYLYQ